MKSIGNIQICSQYLLSFLSDNLELLVVYIQWDCLQMIPRQVRFFPLPFFFENKRGLESLSIIFSL